MNTSVMIKGNRYGIVLVLSDELSFSDLCDQIRLKFIESNKFFDSSVQMAISFEGRSLTSKEQECIINIINQCCDLHISYVIDKDTDTEQFFEKYLEQKNAMDACKTTEESASVSVSNTETAAEEQLSDTTPQQLEHAGIETVGSVDNLHSCGHPAVEVNGDDLGHFYRGTLRSGQSIEFASSIVVIGDVNPGAKIVAKGNIIVIGSLKGTAYAGVNGKPNAFIIALDMNPMQLRIGDLYARSPDSKGFLKRKKQPVKQMQIAFVENNNIYIEPINRSVLNSII